MKTINKYCAIVTSTENLTTITKTLHKYNII